jgi:glycosyltransferase involved in cell wall biosynthesis
VITLIGPAAARLAGAGIVWHFNDIQIPRLIYRLLTGSLGSMADAIVVASKAVAQHALVAGTKHAVLYPPVDAERLRCVDPSSGKRSVLAQLGLDPAAPTVVTVGHLNAVKGHRYLVDALAFLAEKGQRMQAVLVGDRVDHVVAQDVELRVASHGLGDCVRLVGGADDIAPYLSCADVFVLPSLSEGMPMALLEAMAAGLPVVATAVGGVTEIVEDGVNGFLVRPGDARGLALQISRMLDDPGSSRRMGERAQAVALARFSTQSIAARLASIYTQVLTRR